MLEIVACALVETGQRIKFQLLKRPATLIR